MYVKISVRCCCRYSNMKYVLVDLTKCLYDTVCIVQLMTGVRLFSEYLLNFIVVGRDTSE